MYPKLFTVTVPSFEVLGKNMGGPLTLHTYGALMAVAFLVGLWVAAREARKAGLDVQRTTDLAIYTLIGGLVGARLLLAIIEWRYFSQHPNELASLVTSGGVFYGGFLGALPVAWWYARSHSLPGWRTADALAPGLVIGQAIGRLGCFAAGCCYGMPSSAPWAVTFKSIDAQRTVGTPLDVPLHPAQLYETLACLLIYGLLVWMAGRKRFHGQLAVAYVVLYGLARFFIEFYRGDEIRGFLRLTQYRFVSTSQVIAIVLVLAALAIAPYLLKTQRLAPDQASAA
jgi:phosphatidylglycerol:prolipoprotein diacylglycerol transferase